MGVKSRFDTSGVRNAFGRVPGSIAYVEGAVKVFEHEFVKYLSIGSNLVPPARCSLLQWSFTNIFETNLTIIQHFPVHVGNFFI